MCLVLLAIDDHADYRLVVAANRDEFHARASEPARFWPDRPGLIAGRDTVAGGTWLGVTLDGRLALVTNVHEPERPRPAAAPSRGRLPLDFLADRVDAGNYLRTCASRAETYAGFSLIVGEQAQLHYLSNRNHGEPRPLAAGLHGLGNRTLDSGEPKLASGVTDFGAALRATGDLETTLFELLRDDRPRGWDGTTPDHPWREPLSALFVRAPGYGTRCSTLVTIHRNGTMTFSERSYDAAGRTLATVREQWRLDP